ncbi:MAG: glycoside hydrolase family 95 protein [Eubacteriales bacterium]
MKNYSIYLDTPASEWELASPVGCGSLGAMIYGTVDTERLQLNEEHIWAGGPINTDCFEFRDILDKIRCLLLEGKATEADLYAEKALDGKFHRVNSYETAGELYFSLHENGNCTDYRRELNLNSGIASVVYKKDEINYRRELFASYPSQLIAVRFTADKSASINFTSFFKRENIISRRVIEKNILEIKGMTASGGHEFTLLMKFIPNGGTLVMTADTVVVSRADSCAVYITAATESIPELPLEYIWDDLKNEHINDFTSIMERSDISLGETDEILEALPTSERLRRIREGGTDPELISLYFQFGKYLLLGSSRPGTLPANLQGVWNGELNAPWNSDYHTNINLQMNYWHAETANISECTLPLFDYINKYLLESGKRTASVNYQCRGTVLHHLSDVYGFTAPADGLWGLWPLGGAWLCYHFWEHYLYTLDKIFLQDTAYNYISECVQFFLDAMYETENGLLLSGPSTSPENRYFVESKAASLCMSPTMDIEIISGLFRIYIAAESLLGIDPELAKKAEIALEKMPPLKIGKHGQLMEWLDDYDEPEPGHRHISHMFALYPDAAINPSTPETFEGSRKTLERRLKNGGGHTGWSCAWLVALYARLLDGESAMSNLTKLLSKSTRDNLFDTHPPFQIDGNFGGSAAIAEMLLQSHNGVIKFLPALPACFRNGSFERLCVRGGAEVSAEWKNSRVIEFSIYSKTGGIYTINVNGETFDINCDAHYKYNYKYSK